MRISDWSSDVCSSDLMDISRLDEMPPGRQPVETRVMSSERLEEVVEALGRHMDGGGQAYWVCPLVEESETSDQAAAEARAAALKMRFGDRVGVVHGRMKGADKDAVMAAFQSGGQIGRAHVGTPVTYAHPVCHLT